MTKQKKPEQVGTSMSLPKQAEWEKEFDERFTFNELGTQKLYTNRDQTQSIKNFIRNLLSKQEAEHERELRDWYIQGKTELKQEHKKDISLTIHKIIDLIKPVFEEWAAGSRYVTGAWNTGDDIDLCEAYKNDPFWINQKRTAWEQFSYHLDSKIAGIEVTTEKKKYCFTEEYCENKINKLKQQHREELEGLKMKHRVMVNPVPDSDEVVGFNVAVNEMNAKIDKLLNSQKEE